MENDRRWKEKEGKKREKEGGKERKMVESIRKRIEITESRKKVIEKVVHPWLNGLYKRLCLLHTALCFSQNCLPML